MPRICASFFVLFESVIYIRRPNKLHHAPRKNQSNFIGKKKHEIKEHAHSTLKNSSLIAQARDSTVISHRFFQRALQVPYVPYYFGHFIFNYDQQSLSRAIFASIIKTTAPDAMALSLFYS